MLPQLQVPVVLPLGRGLPEHDQVAQRNPLLRPDDRQVLVCGEMALGRWMVQERVLDVPPGVPVPVAGRSDGQQLAPVLQWDDPVIHDLMMSEGHPTGRVCTRRPARLDWFHFHLVIDLGPAGNGRQLAPLRPSERCRVLPSRLGAIAMIGGVVAGVQVLIATQRRYHGWTTRRCVAHAHDQYPRSAPVHQAWQLKSSVVS